MYAADTIYLVANPDVPSVRNAQRRARWDEEELRTENAELPGSPSPEEK